MKKIFALALAAAMAMSMVACGSSEPAEPEVPEVYKTGIGIRECMWPSIIYRKWMPSPRPLPLGVKPLKD